MLIFHICSLSLTEYLQIFIKQMLILRKYLANSTYMGQAFVDDDIDQFVLGGLIGPNSNGLA